MTCFQKTFKRRIESWLRLIGLEPAIYHYVFQKDHRRFRERDRLFAASHPGAVLPPPRLRFDVIACSSAEYYHNTGHVMAEQIQTVIKTWVKTHRPAVCEWGCGPGRILFALEALDTEQAMTLTGTDAFAPSIHWAQSVPSNRISFLLNRMEPPLSLAAASVDFTYAVSVFTHLSEKLTRVWFHEIMRILKPGGIFWFSTHSGAFHRNELDEERRAKLDRGEFVAIPSWHHGSQMYTGIHCPALVRRIVEDSGAEVLAYEPGGNQKYQDAWIVRKKTR